MNYQKRVQVYQETKSVARDWYPNMAITRKYSENIQGIPMKSDSVIEVIASDTLDEYVNLLNMGYNPVLLNMANEMYPGGGVDSGCSAQEENIFRRTNYHMTLLDEYYPIKGSDNIYSRGVTLFRSNEDTGYQFVRPWLINIIASASVKNPELVNGKFNRNDSELEYAKICMILGTAARNGHDSIVLSAFGCGAYRCPARSVARLFRDAIHEYGGYFKKIVFAIKQPQGDLSKGNYSVFHEELVDKKLVVEDSYGNVKTHGLYVNPFAS
jgi:uncharacterized protein (TIGR02452 family)